MTMHMYSSQTRDDFRCALCRQKNVFHCEHDTPYRDRYLGAFESNTPRSYTISSRRSTPQAGMHNNQNSMSNGGLNTGRSVKSNAGAQYHQDEKLDKTKINNQNAIESSKVHEQNKKSKSCVIL